MSVEAPKSKTLYAVAGGAQLRLFRASPHMSRGANFVPRQGLPLTDCCLLTPSVDHPWLNRGPPLIGQFVARCASARSVCRLELRPEPAGSEDVKVRQVTVAVSRAAAPVARASRVLSRLPKTSSHEELAAKGRVICTGYDSNLLRVFKRTFYDALRGVLCISHGVVAL